MSILTKYNARDYEKLFDVRTDYPQDIKQEIKLYSVDKEANNAHVIGSFSYKSGNASDVDLFEPVYKPDKKVLINFFILGIKKIVKDLMASPKQYFMEVKCGLDHLYSDVVIGVCSNNNYQAPDQFFELMNIYYSYGFINDKEYTTIKQIENKPNKDQRDFEIIKKLIRSRSILRWTPNEIYNGYKIIKDMNGYYKYTLNIAVQERSNINVEGIFLNDDNKYSDCSNFFTLSYKTKYGKLLFMNLSDKANEDFLEYRKEDLKNSIYTLMYSKLEPNPVKVIKRILSYGIAFKNVDLVTRAYKLVNTQHGRLYALNSQIKTISKVIQIHGNKHLYKKELYHHLDYIRWEMQTLILLNLDLNESIDAIKYLISEKTRVQPQTFINTLNDISHTISDYLIATVPKMLYDSGLYPIPQFLTPKIKPF